MISEIKSPLIGRPSKFKKELGEMVCNHLKAGLSLNQIGKIKGLPTKQTIINWLNDPTKTEFLSMYQEAREAQSETVGEGKTNEGQTITYDRIASPARVYDLNKYETKAIELKKSFEVATDKDGRLSLTDLWKTAGCPENLEPGQWLRFPQTQGFIDATCNYLNMCATHIIKSKRGKGGGTFAHKQIALAYAKHLSPELHIAVNQVFFERLEEEKNPDLTINRAIESYRKKGKSDNYIQERFTGIITRKDFTKALKKHGVEGIGYGKCTSAVYSGIFGGDANHVRTKKNLPEKANTREHMNEVELATVRLVEMVATKNIEQFNLKGNKACEEECKRASKLISQSVAKALKAA